MAFLHKRTLIATVLGATLLLGGQALAQSAQDMDFLTDAERKAFSHRLQQSMTSAGRAKITAEMNRVVQERRLDLRHQEKAGLPSSPAKP